jgi:hypothetical protein
MILRSIVILVSMAGTAFALDHPRLPYRVLRGGSCWHMSSGIATAEGRIGVPEVSLPYSGRASYPAPDEADRN